MTSDQQPLSEETFVDMIFEMIRKAKEISEGGYLRAKAAVMQACAEPREMPDFSLDPSICIKNYIRSDERLENTLKVAYSMMVDEHYEGQGFRREWLQRLINHLNVVIGNEEYILSVSET